MAITCLLCLLGTEGSAKSSEFKETITYWAKPDSEEPPLWAREQGKEIGSQQGFQVPFYVYLLASSITAIAAVSTRIRLHATPTKLDDFFFLNNQAKRRAKKKGIKREEGEEFKEFKWFSVRPTSTVCKGEGEFY